MNTETQQSNSAQRKSYYKSRRKEYFWDDQNKHWYFLVANDPDRVKFCYASGRMQKINGLDLVVGIETFKLHKPGSVMMRYSLALQMDEHLGSAGHQWGEKVVEIKNVAHGARVMMEKAFAERWGDTVEHQNDIIMDFMNTNRVVRI